MTSALILALGLFGCASAVSEFHLDKWESVVGSPSHNLIVKLETPGYPLWDINTAKAPSLYKDAEHFYYEVEGAASAILLNITMTHDRKRLLMNHEAIVPFEDYSRPPRIGAYQVPASMSWDDIEKLMDQGVLNRQWDGMTLRHRYLELDYDRLVRGDPVQGPWMNNVPALTFRVMGFGAQGRNDVLEAEKQDVLHVTMSDANHGKSDSPKCKYHITEVEFKPLDQSYYYGIPAVEQPQRQEPCTTTQWQCQDYELWESGAPFYRYIWRDRFDKYGRIGSGRHAFMKKMRVLVELWEDAGPAMVMSFGILMSIALVVMGVVMAIKKGKKARELRSLEDEVEEERLIEALANGERGDSEGEKYVDGEEDHEKPLLPVHQQRQKEVEDLIDLGDHDDRR